MELIIEDKLILAAARLTLSNDNIQCIDKMILSVNNWEYFTTNVIQNGLGPLVYKNFSYVKNYSLIPSNTISQLKHTYYISCNRNQNFYKHFQKAVNTLTANGISAIALKGIFLAENIYGDIGLRQMSDIDILVKKEEANNCVNLLHGLGYHSMERHKTKFISNYYQRKHLPPMVSEGVSIEIHLNANAVDCEYNVNINNYWQNAVNSNTGNTGHLELSHNDLLQFISLHLDSHFFLGKIQLYYYTDIAEILKFYQNDFSWDSFEKSCNEYNCRKNVFRHLFLVNKYFDAPLPEQIIEKAREYIDQRTENLFIYYLQGKKDKISTEITHSTISNLEKVKGRKNKFLYLLNDIFPSIPFMKKRYKINNGFFIFGYYLFRMKTGIVVLLKYLIKKKSPE